MIQELEQERDSLPPQAVFRRRSIESELSALKQRSSKILREQQAQEDAAEAQGARRRDAVQTLQQPPEAQQPDHLEGVQQADRGGCALEQLVERNGGQQVDQEEPWR